MVSSISSAKTAVNKSRRKTKCLAAAFQAEYGFSGLLFLHLCEALAAVNRTVLTGLEGDSGFLAAGGAGSGEHLTVRSGCVLAGIAARLASLGFIDEAALRIELLLTGGEHKLGATFFAVEGFVSVPSFLPHLWIDLPAAT